MSIFFGPGVKGITRGVLAAVVGAGLLGSAAQAQMRVGPLSDIRESYNDCLSATEGELDPAALEDRGWGRGTMQSRDGEIIEGGPIIYGHTEKAPIIMLSATEGKGACIVLARIEDLAQFEEFKSAWGDDLPQANDEGEIWFRAGGRRMAQMALTGSREEPSIRLVVGTPLESK